jgi:hypothetical protein
LRYLSCHGKHIFTTKVAKSTKLKH